MMKAIRFLEQDASDGESVDVWTNSSNSSNYGDSDSGGSSDFDFDFDGNLVAAQDVTVSAVLSSIMFNSVIFVLLMFVYEVLRRLLPTVYSSKERLSHTGTIRRLYTWQRDNHHHNNNNKNTKKSTDSQDTDEDESDSQGEMKNATTKCDAPPRPSLFGAAAAYHREQSINSLPDIQPFDWVGPVFGVSWSKVRKIAGLDGYFFLRFIRMNLRITAVSTFWFFLILVPIYLTGDNPVFEAHGWYHMSASNLPHVGWRIWAPVVFGYLFTAFIAFVVKQEYRHYLELRQDFLAKGSAHVNPQHHYSLMVENIPYELRSDAALKDYFDKLFPGKVHSASVVLKLPDLEEASRRCMRTCRRLEKSIAYLHATGHRPVHVVGRARMSICGVDLAPVNCGGRGKAKAVFIDNDIHDGSDKPERGTLVDSISYYTSELAQHSKMLFKMQLNKSKIAEKGNRSLKAENWFNAVLHEASAMAGRILDESAVENDLISPSASHEYSEQGIPQAEHMSSHYGSFSPLTILDHAHHHHRRRSSGTSKPGASSLLEEDHLQDDSQRYLAPFSHHEYSTNLRRWAGRLGLDFGVAAFKVLNKQLDVALEGVLGATMSSTGFVTFLDLSSTAFAASTPLSVKTSVLSVSVAPEPREILWQNAHISRRTQIRREQLVSMILFLGVILWSFPLAAIQFFAKAETISQIPGFEWIMTLHGGTFSRFVNGYLPVVALLGLTMILPVVFEYVAVHYERRKTFSDVQASMLSRYFYYQIATIYVTVTAGSILKSLSDILDHPTNVVQLLGESLPTMVGYFVALLVTKIMAGLPMVFLRLGALSRMLFLKMLSSEKRLTQRELDAIYRLENVQYGWEFPSQLLVVVIVYTYAIICPVILPVGVLFFLGSLLVYKKQVLYVYSPVYESGGAFFPIAVQRSLFGLVCGQLTLLGYTVIRGCYYQPIGLLPLPVLTLLLMDHLDKTYAQPCARLSLERARECDRLSALRASKSDDVSVDAATAAAAAAVSATSADDDAGVIQRRKGFVHSAYRQPVLTELATEPLTYRRGINDAETLDVQGQLRKMNRYATRIKDEFGGL